MSSFALAAITAIKVPIDVDRARIAALTIRNPVDKLCLMLGKVSTAGILETAVTKAMRALSHPAPADTFAVAAAKVARGAIC